jgi:hypothetical protein
MAQNRNLGRRRRHGNITSQRTNNSIEDLVENEGKKYPVAEHTRMMMCVQ